MMDLFKKAKEESLNSDHVRKITKNGEESKRRTPAGIAIEKAQSLYITLSKLDTATISDEERRQLVQELKHLRKALENVSLKY